MYMLKRTTVLLFLFCTLLLHPQADESRYILGTGLCHAQSAGGPANGSDQKNSMGAAKRLRAEGEALQKKGQLAEAIEKYGESQRYYADPKLADHMKMLNDTLMKQYIEAAKKLRGEGEALQKQGKIAAAIEKYALSLQYYPDSSLEAHISKLQDALYLSKRPKIELDAVPEGFKDELVILEKLRKDPGRANMEALAALRYQYALSLTKQAAKKNNEDTYRLALIYAKSATELAPNMPDYWAFFGQLYDRMGKDNELTDMIAEDALQKAVELNPNNDTYRLILGQAFYRHGNLSDALEQFEKVLRRDPKLISPPIISTMCSAYAIDAQYSRGVKVFREVLEKQPNADSARLALAILVYQQKDSLQATEELNRIIKRADASEENRKYALSLLEEWKKAEVKP